MAETPREWLPEIAPHDLLALLNEERDRIRRKHTYDMTPNHHIKLLDQEIRVSKKIALVERSSREATDDN